MPRRRKAISDIEPGEWDFLTEAPKSVRTYDSSLSKPGKFCANENCRAFISGEWDECHTCWTAV